MPFMMFVLMWWNVFSGNGERESGELVYNGGEKLVYKVYYNWNFVWLPAGEVAFEVKEEPDSYHIEVTGNTYASYEWFYKVRDKYHSYIDKKSGLPKLYIRDIQQGSYRRYEKIVFDYNSGKAHSYTGRSMVELSQKEIPLDRPYYDMVSCMYFLRNQRLNQTTKHFRTSFHLLLDDEIYQLAVTRSDFHKALKIKDTGTFRAISAEADVIAGHVFDEDAKLKFYVGDDLNCIPVLIESPLVVGSVKAVLMECRNLKYPFESKLK